MTTVFLSGHRDFGNRGCEAIVRSTVGIVRRSIPGAAFIVPSTNIGRDRALWPAAETQGVQFRDCLHQSLAMRVFGKTRKRLGWLNGRYPPIAPPAEARRLIDGADIVLSIGGDNYSEDYSLPFLPLLLDNYAMSRGKPVVLWGASVGPFRRDHAYQVFMTRHMRRYASVNVREARSESYCRKELGVSRVSRFADPAFALRPETVEESLYGDGEYIGVNISPLVLQKLGAAEERFLDELTKALKNVRDMYGLDVLLVPHVMAYSGPNDDRIALRKLAARLDVQGIPHQMVADGLNAAQLKAVIGTCRVFIGARTHSTIAAMSMGVPVVSIGYSVKATGINEHVFGDARFVVDFRRLQATGLIGRIQEAMATNGGAKVDEDARQALRQSAYAAGLMLREFLDGSPVGAGLSRPLHRADVDQGAS